MSTATANKLKIKDIITVVLLALINVVIFFASSVLYATPITIILMPVFFALLEGIVYFIIGMKVKKARCDPHLQHCPRHYGRIPAVHHPLYSLRCHCRAAAVEDGLRQCEYFTTDTTAALRAAEINADVILMAKNGVDGVYSADPKLDESAVKFDQISYSDVLAKDLKVMDQTAITLCKDNDIDLCVFNMQEDGNIAKACDGQKIGTTISGGK